MARRLGIAGITVIVAAVVLGAQEREDRTLLTQEQMTAIINEVSGERAMHHVLELVPYQRVRLPEEYKGHFRESEVMARLRQGVRLQQRHDRELRRRPGLAADAGRAVDDDAEEREAVRHPRHRAVARVAQRERRHHRRADRRRRGPRAGLRGQGRQGQVRARSTGSASRSTRRPFSAARIGVLGDQRHRRAARDRLPESDRLDDGQRAAGHRRVGGVARTCSANCSAARCAARRSRFARSSRACRCRRRAEIVHAEIPGDGSTTQEVAISGHLYEGVIKQGANDDNSGCALTLEIGRAYLKLINEGKLPRPKRTINFQWVPEISGTNAWLNAHPGQSRRHHRRPELRHGSDPRRREPQLLDAAAHAGHVPVVPQRHRAEHDGVRRRHLARARALPRQRLRADPAGRVAARQRRRVLHQDRQALRLERSRDLHAARHSGRHVHHVAGHVVPLVGGHARQAGSDAVQARGRRRHSARSRCSRPAPTRWPRACSTTTSAAASSRMGESHTKGLGYMADATDAACLHDGLQGSARRDPASGRGREGRRRVGERAVDERRRRQEEDGGVRAAHRQARGRAARTK